MGNVSPQGKARFLKSVLPYTLWLQEDIDAAKRRYRETGSEFALDLEKFAYVLSTTQKSARELFDVFDAGSVGLVDAFESLGTVVLASATEIESKVSFVFDLYDFNGNNKITADEMVIMLRSAAAGLSKVDNNLVEPSTQTVEAVVSKSFAREQKDPDEELSRDEFNACCINSVQIREFLEYVDGAAGHARIPHGGSWSDPDWGDGVGAFVRDCHSPHRAVLAWPNVRWRRPTELVPDELQLVISGLEPSAVTGTGLIAASWLPAVIELVATRPALIQRLFVKTGQEERGRFCLQFYHDAEWRLVYVDDRLPCTPQDAVPLFLISEQPNELWAMLIHKAHAKLFGSYESSAPGSVTSGLEDLTGGLASRLFPYEYSDEDLVRTINSAAVDGVCGAAFLPSPPPGALEEDGTAQRGGGRADPRWTAVERSHHAATSLAARGGSVCGVVYAVLGTRMVEGNAGSESELMNVRIEVRVPSVEHARAAGWVAQLARGAKGKDAEALGVTEAWQPRPSRGHDDHGGTHREVCWLTLDQFRRAFNTLYVCRIFDERWVLQRRQGRWTSRSSGGSFAHTSWVKNEQYALEVFEECDVVVTVQQRDRRNALRESEGTGTLPPQWDQYACSIGFAVVAHDFGDGEFRNRLEVIVEDNVRAMSIYARRRAVSESFRLEPGRYVVIPSTLNPGGVSDFTLLVRTTSSQTELRARPEIVWGSEREDVAANGVGGFSDDDDEDEGEEKDDDVSEMMRVVDDAQDTPNLFRDDTVACALLHLHNIAGELCEAVDELEARKESLERRLLALKKR